MLATAQRSTRRGDRWCPPPRRCGLEATDAASGRKAQEARRRAADRPGDALGEASPVAASLRVAQLLVATHRSTSAVGECLAYSCRLGRRGCRVLLHAIGIAGDDKGTEERM